MFLIRDSQQHAQCFVLSLCYKLKIKHYLLIPVSSLETHHLHFKIVFFIKGEIRDSL